MSKKKLQAPVNNKSIFHSMGQLFEMVANDDLDLEKAQMLLAITDRAHTSLRIELERTKIQALVNIHKAELREIETKGFDDTLNSNG